MKALAIAALAAVTISGTAARAANYSFSFTDYKSKISDFSGKLTTASNGASQLIVQLAGTFQSKDITLDAPRTATAVGGYMNDNLFYPGQTATDVFGVSGGYLDDAGLGFSADGQSYDISFLEAGSGCPYALAASSNRGFFGDCGMLTVTDLRPSVSAAPEPSTWLLMFAGIGCIGLILRQAKRKMGSRSKYLLPA